MDAFTAHYEFIIENVTRISLVIKVFVRSKGNF